MGPLRLSKNSKLVGAGVLMNGAGVSLSDDDLISHSDGASGGRIVLDIGSAADGFQRRHGT
jgi:succinyl-CoA synthetase beta subunit